VARDRCAFVHVPPLGKPHSVEEITAALKVAILDMLAQVAERDGCTIDLPDQQGAQF